MVTNPTQLAALTESYAEAVRETQRATPAARGRAYDAEKAARRDLFRYIAILCPVLFAEGKAA